MLTTYLNIGFYIHNNKGIQSPPNTEQQNANKWKIYSLPSSQNFRIRIGNNYLAPSGKKGRFSRVMVNAM